MGLHVYQIGIRLVAAIEELLTDIATEEAGDATLARASQLPQVEFGKVQADDDGMMDVEEGIKVSPLSPRQAGGTNERDDVAYRFLIVIGYGSWTETIPINWPTGFYEQAIRQRFHHRRIGSLGLLDSWEIRCMVEPGDLPDIPKIRQGVDATTLVLSSFIRETRRIPN